jgi:hypothetical protein
MAVPVALTLAVTALVAQTAAMVIDQQRDDPRGRPRL